MKALRHGYRIAALAVLLGIVLSAVPAGAATQTLLNSNSAGGWSATAPDDANVGLQVLGVLNGTLFLKKQAVFESSNVNQDGSIAPIPIQFLAGNTGIHKIVIDFEELGNETGKSFSNFTMTLNGNATFDAKSKNFNGDVFSKTDVSSDSKVVTLSNGTLNDGESFFPGFGKSGGDLVINATGSFSLDEGTGGHQIPLPAAAWMGVSGLIGMAALKGVKQLRKLVA